MTDSRPRHRRIGSEFLHLLDDLASRPLLAIAVVAVDLLWLVFSSAFGFPTDLDSVFQTLVAAVSLAMLFVIQHTQSRQQLVVQRKLDEILHALPRADNALIAVEEGSDAELRAAHETHRERRGHAVTPPDG